MGRLIEYSYSYFDDALSPGRVKRAVQFCVDEIRSRNLEPDAIVATGVSGLAIAPIVAYELHLPLVIVRKRADSSTHSNQIVEGCLPEKYVIIDDLTETGETIERVRAEMNEYAERRYITEKPKCIGAVLYQGREAYTYSDSEVQD